MPCCSVGDDPLQETTAVPLAAASPFRYIGCGILSLQNKGMEVANMKPEENVICFFRGKNAFLSNFYPVTVRYEGMSFPSVEAASQAAKSWDVRHRLACSLSSAKNAKALGRKVKLREDWEKKKIGIMYELLTEKFRNPELREKLLATGDAVLVEGNRHGDRFWGQVNGEGENWLGKLLMDVRDKIREEEAQTEGSLFCHLRVGTIRRGDSPGGRAVRPAAAGKEETKKEPNKNWQEKASFTLAREGRLLLHPPPN